MYYLTLKPSASTCHVKQEQHVWSCDAFMLDYAHSPSYAGCLQRWEGGLTDENISESQYIICLCITESLRCCSATPGHSTMYHLHAFFWVKPRHLNFICQHFGTLRLFHLHRRVGISSYLPVYEDGTECSKTSAYKIQTPGNYPEESLQHSEHSKSLKSRMYHF